MRKCAVCDAEFEPEHPRAIYCTDICRVLAHDRQSAESAARLRSARLMLRTGNPLPRRTCSVCGELFTPKTTRNHICSDRCRAKLEAARLERWVEQTARYADDGPNE